MFFYAETYVHLLKNEEIVKYCIKLSDCFSLTKKKTVFKCIANFIIEFTYVIIIFFYNLAHGNRVNY